MVKAKNAKLTGNLFWGIHLDYIFYIRFCESALFGGLEAKSRGILLFAKKKKMKLMKMAEKSQNLKEILRFAQNDKIMDCHANKVRSQ